jgi:two-component system response regulator RegX3
MGSAAAFHVLEQDSDYILRFADIEVNVDRSKVTRNGKPVSLTAAEFELLTCFLHNAGRELTRDMILDSVWSNLPSPNTRTVDAHVLRLRRKLEEDPNNPRHFVTIYRLGYSFRA